MKRFHEDLGARGLRLLGFKPRERLKLYHNMKASYFVEPTETRPGSTVAMEALVAAMAAKDKVAICRFRRASEKPRLVALLPQLRELEPGTASVRVPILRQYACALICSQSPLEPSRTATLRCSRPVRIDFAAALDSPVVAEQHLER